MPVTVDIGSSDEVFIGEDKALEFGVVDAAGDPENISGWTFAFAVRLRRHTPGDPLLSKASGTGITITDAPGGVVTVLLERADTDALKNGTYYYGLARTNDGSYDVVAEGQLVLRKAAL